MRVIDRIMSSTYFDGITNGEVSLIFTHNFIVNYKTTTIISTMHR